MEQILQMMAELPQCCHYCEYRHSYCGKTDDEILAIYETKDCPEFVPGKCYVCAVYQALSGEELCQCRVCDDTFYPDGCSSFKPGDGYEELLELVKEEPAREEKEYREQTRGDRRRKNARKKKHLKQLAKIGWWPSGAYETEDYKGRPFIKRYWRGQRSKWIKKKCNKRFRRTQEVSRERGAYRKYSEFWWDYL